MNPRLDRLQAYPFERLRRLLEGVLAPAGISPINLGIGEPQHPTPSVITDALVGNLKLLGKYPPTGGSPELRQAIADWHARRYGLSLDPAREILPVAGTREALFGFAQAVLDPADPGVVLLPNPFYQIYEGAAVLAGATPVYVPTPASNGYRPDWSAVPAEVWPQVRLAYVCSPGNPTGAVMRREDWAEVLDLARAFGFVVAADECYSELYNGEDAPVGALQEVHRLTGGFGGFVSFNSLSKRSSAPGLRSGFVAGDSEIVAKFLLYRTYHGAAPSSLTQAASVPAWGDEAHVVENREKYRAKFEAARRIVPGIGIPEAGFFLWLPVGDDEAFTRRAFAEQGLTVLPGRYLARDVEGHNPGAGYVRVALVPDLDVIEEALTRLAKLL